MLEGFEQVLPLKVRPTRAKLNVDGQVYVPVKVVRLLEINLTEPRYLVFYNPKTMTAAVRPITEGKANDGSYPMMRVAQKSKESAWRFYLQPIVVRHGLQLSAGEVDTTWDAENRILYFDLSSLRRETKGRKTREVGALPDVEVA